MNRAMVFYNENKGYIFSSYAKARKLGFLVVINPVITAEANETKDEVLKKIEMAYEVSKNNPETDYDLANKYCFWECMGIKTFKDLCKKFVAVEIIEKDGCIYLYKQHGNSNGTYTRSEAQEDCMSFDVNTDFHYIAESALKLLNNGAIDAVTDIESFVTLGKRLVKFNVPSDEFVDYGDGGTDAYKIYRENNSENYIAFLIDNGYENLSEEAIRSVLERQFGIFTSFSFDNSDETKIVINGENNKYTIESNIYILQDEYIEIQLYKINGVKSIISDEYHKIIDSVKILR